MTEDRHKMRAIPFRAASEDDDLWVRQHAAYIGETLTAVLDHAVAAYRAQVEAAHLATFGSPYEPGENTR